MPNIILDKTTGATIYLSMESLEVEIVTSSSSNVKLMVPEEENEARYVEIGVPGVLRINIRGRRGVNTVVG